MDDVRWTAVPRDASSRNELLAERPVAWEYLLFGSWLFTESRGVQNRWRDFVVGYSPRIGPAYGSLELQAEVRDRMSRAIAIVSNLERVFSPEAQAAAFGPPGTAGDAGLVEHLAKRVVSILEQLLDWNEEVRSWRVEDEARALKEAVASMIDQPIRETYEFVSRYIETLESNLASLQSDPDLEISISLPITLEIPDEITERVKAELEKLA